MTDVKNWYHTSLPLREPSHKSYCSSHAILNRKGPTSRTLPNSINPQSLHQFGETEFDAFSSSSDDDDFENEDNAGLEGNHHQDYTGLSFDDILNSPVTDPVNTSLSTDVKAQPSVFAQSQNLIQPCTQRLTNAQSSHDLVSLSQQNYLCLPTSNYPFDPTEAHT